MFRLFDKKDKRDILSLARSLVFPLLANFNQYDNKKAIVFIDKNIMIEVI